MRPAQNRSNDNNPLGGVTLRKLSMTPLGKSDALSSCHLSSISDKNIRKKLINIILEENTHYKNYINLQDYLKI